jgi:putative dehydrogenase
MAGSPDNVLPGREHSGEITMSKAVGVVGLGIMGGAISGSLAASGWRVAGFDIDPGRRREVASLGIQEARTIGDLVNEVDIILTSLPNPAALHATVDAVCAAKATRKVVIEASTLALEDKLLMKEALAEAGHVPLDCPISGTGAQAKLRDLAVYASGNAKAIAQLRPFFLSFARQVFDVGEFGNGSKVKFVANLLVAINNVATAEAMVLAQRSGLDLNRMVEWIGAGAGTSRIFEKRAPLMAANHYSQATMKLSVWKKDIAVISKFAHDLDSPTPLFTATLPVYAAANAKRPADDDTASVCAVLQEMTTAKTNTDSQD